MQRTAPFRLQFVTVEQSGAVLLRQRQNTTLKTFRRQIRSIRYLEALQQFQFRVERETFLMVHLDFLPFIDVTGELQT